jgi:hypothetical protein
LSSAIRWSARSFSAGSSADSIPGVIIAEYAVVIAEEDDIVSSDASSRRASDVACGSPGACEGRPPRRVGVDRFASASSTT